MLTPYPDHRGHRDLRDLRDLITNSALSLARQSRLPCTRAYSPSHVFPSADCDRGCGSKCDSKRTVERQPIPTIEYDYRKRLHFASFFLLPDRAPGPNNRRLSKHSTGRGRGTYIPPLARRNSGLISQATTTATPRERALFSVVLAVESSLLFALAAVHHRRNPRCTFEASLPRAMSPNGEERRNPLPSSYQHGQQPKRPTTFRSIQTFR